MKAFVFQDFKETIERAESAGFLTENARLFLGGRIQFAGERGDLSPNQVRELFSLLRADFMTDYRRDMEIGTFGEPEIEIPAPLTAPIKVT